MKNHKQISKSGTCILPVLKTREREREREREKEREREREREREIEGGNK